MRPDRSLDAGYFDGIFAGDDDPWGLASSAYESAKFDATIAAIDDRRYPCAIEIGCAHGVLTQRLAPLCDDLLAIDISARAIALAAERCRDRPQVRFARCGFPGETPAVAPLDLAVLSEVAYYWDDADLARAAAWLGDALAPGGRLLLVHFTGETDYPKSGDDSIETLAAAFGATMAVERAERHDRYRLDLWRRR